MANNLHRRVRFGLFEFDVDTGELRREGTVVKLAPQPARLLAHLVKRPGAVVLRDELRRELWGDDTFVDFERGLNFCITQVRAALGDASDNPRFVQTVPRRGYRFIAPVAEIDHRLQLGGQPPALGTIPDSGDKPPVGGEAPRPRTVPKLAVAVFAIAMAAGIWWALGGKSLTPAEDVGKAPTRVVVLPITNLTGDSGADYLANALTDEVIAELGSISRARVAVIARTSAMRYRTGDKTIADIGRELDVQYVVESSLQRLGRGVRISSRVVPVTQQAPMAAWEEVVDPASNAADTGQTQAAIRIARRVVRALLPEADTLQEAPSTANAEAWDTFMRAAASMSDPTPAHIRRAISQLQEATRHDPSFAAAWARLAEAEHLLVMMGVAEPGQAYAIARDAADRALALAPASARAHLAHGLVELWHGWRPSAAAAAFARALELNPSLAAAHHDYAWSLVALGRTDDAIRHITISRDLDPLSTRASTDVGWLYLHVRQPEAAARACQHTLAIDASALEPQACLERAFAQRQLFEAAYQAARATLQGYEDAPAATADAANGLRAIWEWRLRQLERVAETRWVSPYTLAVHYVLTGHHDEAIGALEDAYARRAGMMVFLARDPAMDPLRGHPRFDALVRTVSETSR